LKAAIAGSNQLIKKTRAINRSCLSKRFQPFVEKAVFSQAGQKHPDERRAKEERNEEDGCFSTACFMKRVDPPAFKTSRIRTSLA
jgi:hypothetical protein